MPKKNINLSLSPEDLAIENDDTFHSIGRDPYGILDHHIHSDHYVIVPLSERAFKRISSQARADKITPTGYIARIVENV